VETWRGWEALSVSLRFRGVDQVQSLAVLTPASLPQTCAMADPPRLLSGFPAGSVCLSVASLDAPPVKALGEAPLLFESVSLCLHLPAD